METWKMKGQDAEIREGSAKTREEMLRPKGECWDHAGIIRLTKMVSMGDTEISLHIQSPCNCGGGGGREEGVNWGSQNSSVKSCPKFNFGVEGTNPNLG